MRIAIIEFLSSIIRSFRSFWLRNLSGYINISPKSIIEGGVLLDKVYPENIHIESGCLVARGSVVLSHEHVKRSPDDEKLPMRFDTYIGKNCFIGINAIICPGVKVGESCIIAAGAVVNTDIPPNSLVAGVPGRVKKNNIFMVHGAYVKNKEEKK